MSLGRSLVWRDWTVIWWCSQLLVEFPESMGAIFIPWLRLKVADPTVSKISALMKVLCYIWKEINLPGSDNETWNLSSIHRAKEWILGTWKHTGKVYFRRQRYKVLSIDTERGWRGPKRQGLQQFCIFTSIDLYIFGWLMTLIYGIFWPTSLNVSMSSLSVYGFLGSPSFSVSPDIATPSLDPFSRPQLIS